MEQSAIHELVDSFVAELTAAGSSTALRERIGAAFMRWTDSGGLVFLERMADARYVATLAVNAPAGAIEAHGPLVRWLRVNNELLVFRDRPDVYRYLSADERAYIAGAFGDACVPMVTGGTLVACLLLCHVQDVAALSKRRLVFEACGGRAAEHWQHVTRAEREQARRDALGQSHRLGVAGQVAASVAHEVRNPLAAIRSLVQFAKDTPLPPEERDSILRDVLEEVDRIDHTVTGMLELSRPPSAQRQSVDVGDLLRGATRFVKAYAHRQGVIVSVEDDGMSTRIFADARELRQMVTNLLLNACQACSGGGRVTAVVRREPREDGQTAWVQFDVCDSGAGIAPEHVSRVFEPFFTTKPQGTGLGLPFCRDVVLRHGGAISVASTPGKGTVVSVRLPISEADEYRTGG